MFLEVALFIGSIFDIKRGKVPDIVWLIALPEIIFIHNTLLHSVLRALFALPVILVLYHLDIFGGADSKALTLVIFFNEYGIYALFLTVMAVSLPSLALLLYYSAHKLKANAYNEKYALKFPLIPCIFAINMILVMLN